MAKRRKVQPGAFSANARAVYNGEMLPLPTDCKCQGCHTFTEVVQNYIRDNYVGGSGGWAAWFAAVKATWKLARLSADGTPEMPLSGSFFNDNVPAYPSDHPAVINAARLFGGTYRGMNTSSVSVLETRLRDMPDVQVPFAAFVAAWCTSYPMPGHATSAPFLDNVAFSVHTGCVPGLTVPSDGTRRDFIAFLASFIRGNPDYRKAQAWYSHFAGYFGFSWFCESRIVRRKGPRTNHAKSRSRSIVNRPKYGERLTGLELEHNLHHQSLTDSWIRAWPGASVVHDGSCGREAVTPPLFGTRLLRCLKDACDILARDGDPVDARCSVHVHVDATDFSWADMFRLMAVWRKIEPLMFVLAGQERAENTYCRPVNTDIDRVLKAKEPKLAAVAIFAINSMPAQVTARDKFSGKSLRGYDAVKEWMSAGHLKKKSAGRYRAMNISPWLAARTSTGTRPSGDGRGEVTVRKDSTVEFRLHKNCANPQRLFQWATLLSRLMSWVAVASDRDVDRLPSTPLRALVHMVPESRDWILRRIASWRNTMPFGFGLNGEDDASETIVVVPKKPKRIRLFGPIAALPQAEANAAAFPWQEATEPSPGSY